MGCFPCFRSGKKKTSNPVNKSEGPKEVQPNSSNGSHLSGKL
jgi:hypothetical protein